MVLMLARVIGIGIETADMLVHEVLMRNLRDRRAVARYAGITGAPNESGDKRREKGLSRAGNARVRRGLVQLAWRWLTFQKDSALAQWYRQRTASARGDIRKTMIVGLARKLLIALWRYLSLGDVPQGAVLRPAQRGVWHALISFCWRVFSIIFICSRASRSRAMSRRISPSMFGGNGAPSGPRNASRRSQAFTSFTLKLRIPKRTSVEPGGST